MGANAVQPGDFVKLQQLDALYERLYNLRNTHATSTHQLNASNIPVAQQTSGISVGTRVSPNVFERLQQELKDLANSQWYQSNTSGTIVKMTDFSNNFTIPTIGELLKASDFNLVENTITVAEGIIPSYSGKYSSDYSSDYSSRYRSRYSSDYSSEYGSRYGTRYSSEYGSQYGSQYTSRYGTQYGSQYTSRYGTQYGSQYSSRYGTRYGTQYSSQYSSRYGSRYGTRYSMDYGLCYGNRYGTRYSGKYTAKYAGQNSIKC